MTIEEAFGESIRKCRRVRSISQEKFALLCGLDRSFLSNIECGKQQPSLVTIFSIAEALNIPPAKLIEEVESVLAFYGHKRHDTKTHDLELIGESNNGVNVGDHSVGCEGTETILLAEDSEQVLKILSDAFIMHGYKTILANDGQEACLKYSQNISEIKLVIVDVVMPHKNGDEVYEQIKALNPNVSIILISGFRAVDKKLPLGSVLMEKPFNPIDLIKLVRTTLDA